MKENYNWNGKYKILKSLDKWVYKLGEFELLMFNEYKGDLVYSIHDSMFGYPSLANTMDTEYALQMRQKTVCILDELVENKYLERIVENEN